MLIPYHGIPASSFSKLIFLNNEVIFQLNQGIYNSEEHLVL